MFDVAIIGSGAAGLSAALTLKSRNINFIWFGQDSLSSKIRSAEKILNYPGLPMVSGEEMSNIFQNQIKEMDISIENKTVTGVYYTDYGYSILCNQDLYEAKSVILATGVAVIKPIKGELEFVGRGVSYCATCDGFLYKGKDIAVICTTKELEHEIDYLKDLANKTYIVPLYKEHKEFKGNIEIIKSMPKEVIGERKVSKLVFNNREINVDGIFMLKEAVSPSILVGGLEEDNGHIKVDRECKTNLKGCFAAGDCTGRPYQYTKAVGEGNIAAHSVLEYLSNLK